MIKLVSAVLLLLPANAAMAEGTRQLQAHEHGLGQLDIAFVGDQVAMELHAPGADIVGFEYAAESREDHAKVDAAVAALLHPLDLFSLPDAAGCKVVKATASLEGEKDQNHGKHAEHEEAHDGHEDHDADHDHDGHAEHKEGRDQEAHGNEAGHTEFHAEYLLKCANILEANKVSFSYFDTFPNALKLEIQVISERGAIAFDVERDAPTLDLR